ncbi:MAG: RagB/SusD family nutrient uptake outer membrane protein, partial [Sphingobacteriales bacterium]
AINRANYVIENVARMQAEGIVLNPASLDVILGEARMLRGLCYFKLIAMWGDVPYFTFVVAANAEVSDLARSPIGQVRDSILADYTYAIDKLPATASAQGRSTKASALALRGKLNLYWGSWKKNGWPELEGFTQDQAEAMAAYTAATEDFDAVINDFGLDLYMGGDPGQIDALGEANVLPNYYHLFTPRANGNPEMVLAFNHGGINTGQGEELMRDFSGRSHEGSQAWVTPRYELADRYQLLSTGDFADPLIPMNPTTNANARTTLNSAVNPQSYADRDYRMKSTIQWDYEKSIGLAALQSTGMTPFIYRTWAVRVDIGGTFYTTYNTGN